MKKYINKKSIIIFLVTICCILIVTVIFMLKNYQKNQFIILKNLKAENISEKYDSISYGAPIQLNDNVIIKSGSYNLTGSYNCLTINTSSNVQLNLKDVDIKCSNGPAIYIADANIVNINLSGENNIESNTSEILGGAIYSKSTLIFSGDGEINISSNFDGISTTDDLIIKNGTYHITSNDDGIRGKDSISIINGNFILNTDGSGIKSTNEEKINLGSIVIDKGTYKINSKNDAIEAASDLIINDGEFKIQTIGNANENSTKALKAKNIIQINNGDFNIKSNDDGIHSTNKLLLLDGNIVINSCSDAIQANGMIQIDGGDYIIDAKDGIKASYLKMNNGKLSIKASDKGITIFGKITNYNNNFDLNDGNLNIHVGRGNTIAIKSRGDININGGTTKISASTPFNYGGNASHNGGNLIVNNQEITEISMDIDTSKHKNENEEDSTDTNTSESKKKESGRSSHGNSNEKTE